MRLTQAFLSVLGILGACAWAQTVSDETPKHIKRLVIAASALLDAVRRVVFVMKGGVVYKNVTRSAIPVYAGVQP